MFSASYQLFCVIVRVVQHVLWVCQPPITIAKCKRIGFMISWPKLHMSPFFAGHVTVRFARAWCVFISRDRVYGDCFCLLLYYEDGMMGLWLCFIPGCFEHPILALAFLVPVPSFSFKGVGICHAIGENKPKTTVCATRLCMTVETSWRDPGESDCSSWAMGSACAATKAKQCNLRIQKKRQQLPYVWGWWGWFRSRSCMVSLVMCVHIMYVYIYIYVCTIIIQLYIYIYLYIPIANIDMAVYNHTHVVWHDYTSILLVSCFGRSMNQPLVWRNVLFFMVKSPCSPGFFAPFFQLKNLWQMVECPPGFDQPCCSVSWSWAKRSPCFPKEEDEIGTPGNGHKCRVNRQFCTEIPNWLGRSVERSSSAILCASNQKITQEEWIEWVNGLGCSLWFLSMNVEVSCKSTELDSGTGSACWKLGNLFIRR